MERTTCVDDDGVAGAEASFREVVEKSPEAMFVHGPEEGDFDILYVNPSMLAILGYADDSALIGRRSIDTFVHPDDRARLVSHRRRRHAGEGVPPIDLRWVCTDGSIRDIQAVSRPVRFGRRSAWLVYARDVTERNRQERERAEAERVLRESEERHRALFEANPLPSWIFDPRTLAFVAVNDAMVRTYGYSRDELLAMSVLDVIIPEDAAELRDGVAASTDGQVIDVGVKKQRRKDGTIIDLDITVHRLTMQDRPVILGIGNDVTHALQLEQQLRQSQKLEAIGQLAGGIAHDFNNILAAILSNAEMALESLGGDHQVAPEVGEILLAATRAAGLTRQLLAFSRTEEREVKPLSLNGIVTSIERMLSRIVGEHIVIKTRLAPALGTVEANAGQLEQVLMNLIVNARDAMPSGGRVVVETSNIVLDQRAAGPLELAAGRYVTLAVTDTGCGMNEYVRSRIFDPFFTTKAVGKGTGLGLAMVFGIVKQSGGALAVDSEVGRGTTFRVYLPRIDQRATVTALPPPFVAPRGSGTVLVVEDDAQVRTVLRRYLARWGYTCLEASNGEDALAVARAHDGPIELLITDLVMPEMNGRILSRRMRDERPSTRILFMSGYTEHPSIHDMQLAADDYFLAKPFTAELLSHAVQRALSPTCTRATVA